MDPKRLDLDVVYRSEADRIFQARQKAIAIHSSGDIRASGDEVEEEVRHVIAERLPYRYRTTHGHILDYCSRVSPQLDIIIAENLAAKSLFETADGTEYVPYESVYAFAEVKSTYYKAKEPIQGFSQSLGSIRTNLTRLTNVKHPVLTFMLFAESNDFSVADIEPFYRATPREDLPSFVCFLNLGTIVFSKFLLNGLGQPVPVTYFLNPAVTAPVDEKHKWALMQLGNSDTRAGTNLMFLHLSLVQHLHSCGAPTLNLYPYFVLSLNWTAGEIFE
jgi:hypothetical protein